MKLLKQIRSTTRVLIILHIICALCFFTRHAFAGTLTSVSMTPDSLTAGDTTNYTLQFTTPSGFSSGDYIILYTEYSGSGGPDVSAATLTSITGGSSLTGSVTFKIADRITIHLTGGSAPAGSAITVVYANVLNPPTAGTGPDYRILINDSSSENVDSAVLGGNTYTSSAVPTVTNPIDDYTGNYKAIAQEGGETVIKSDLNTVFGDGDGDPLTFSVVAGHDTGIVTATIDGNELSITPQGEGTTTITIEADDHDDGTVTDAFDVQVLGLLTPANVEPVSLEPGATGNVVITLTPSTPLLGSVNDQLFLDWPSGFIVSSATLVSVTGGTTNVTLFANSTNTGFRLNSGSWESGATITITIGGITNPSNTGTTGTYRLRAQDSGDEWFSLATIPGDKLSFGNTMAPPTFLLLEKD